MDAMPPPPPTQIYWHETEEHPQGWELGEAYWRNKFCYVAYGWGFSEWRRVGPSPAQRGAAPGQSNATCRDAGCVGGRRRQRPANGET